MPEETFTIDRIRSQAVSIPSGAYLYFLLRDGEVVYVGQSSQVWSRIAVHLGDKTFNQVAFFQCDPASVSLLEAESILRFRPEYNVTIPLNTRWLNRNQIKRKLQINLRIVNKLLHTHRVEQIGEYYNVEQLEAHL